MCSICGALYPTIKNLQVQSRAGLKVMEAMRMGSDRGRDAFGFKLLTTQGSLITHKQLKSSDHFTSGLTVLGASNAAVVISNCRAEPTTEYLKHKRESDVQPYTCGKWTVVHNGTIANDKELIKEYGLEPESKIDSAVLPCLFSKLLGDCFDVTRVKEVLLNQIQGSYALAIIHTDYPEQVILANNYKPLYLGYQPEDKYWIFASQKEYITGYDISAKLDCGMAVEAMPAYSICALHNGVTPHAVEFESLYSPREGKKALVVCSGGLDSTVAAAAMQHKGYDITLLHFKYRCRAEKQEVHAVKEISKYFGCEYMFVETDMFKDVIKGSPLTNTEVKAFAESEAGAEFAHEWVPARNLIMLSIAVGIAESHGFDVVVLGNNLEESGAYPDNEMEFINRLNWVLPYAVADDKRVRIQMPVGNMMKREIVALGLKLQAPMHLTWSCYNDGNEACGHCGPCYMRDTAFRINGEDSKTWRPVNESM